MSRHRSGPNPLLIVLIGALVVFGGYYVWTGFLSFLEDEGDITAQVTRAAFSTATAQAAPPSPTRYIVVTFTPLPPCQMFTVSVELARYRSCPSENNRDCPVRDTLPFGTEVCVYARAPENPEWYVVELNPGGAYRDIVYMHESVIKPLNPTPTPTVTFTPLPTISLTPSDTPPPTVISSPTNTPNPATPPTPTPTLTPSPTPPQITIWTGM
ncbi:MAG: hypothetical protein JW910_17375, partial [Anaerolineae bacterium]|nr:hypothetical protein [Anaerolineae bacterium]